MAKKEVTVVINGEEYVSKAAQEAEAGLTGFAGAVQKLKDKLVPVIDVTKLAELAVRLLSAAFRAAKDFVLDSFAAYDRFSATQARLAAQSKLTGIAQADLEKSVSRARKEFQLSEEVATNAAITTGKYASRAGDATRQNELLARALDLGAAAGLNAADTMEALEQGLRGQDEGFDKLLGKNPSAIWKEYADANGLAVGKMTDAEKRLAELTAIVDAGAQVQGTYNARLETGAGKQDLLNNSIDESKKAFGQALQPLRILVVEGLTGLVNIATPVIVAMAKIANFVGETFVGSFKLAQSALGGVVEGIGKITGIKALEAWGAANSRAMEDYLGKLRRIEGQSAGTSRAVESQGRAHQLATVPITASSDAIDKHTEANKKHEASHKPLKLAISITQEALDRLAQSAKNQLPPQNAQEFNAALDKIRQNADALIAKLPPITEGTGDAASNTKDMAREIETTARGAIDAAGAFGVIDEKAQRSLNSAVSIASAVGEMAKSGFSFAGAVGVIGGVASLVSTMMSGDGDRKRLLRENNQRLAEVRDGLAEFTLEISGEDQQTLTDILTEGLGDGPFDGSEQMPSLLKWLKDMGFGENRLDQIAKDLGINIRDKNGNIFYDGLVSLQTALLNTNKTPRKNFGNDLSAIEDGFDVNNTDAAGQVQALGNLGGEYSNLFKGIVDMNDLTGTRTRLRQLFADFQAGKISLKDMGGMSRSQFQSFLTMLIGRVDQAIGTSGSPPPAAPGSGSTDVGRAPSSVVVGGGSPNVPTETVQAVIKAMDTNLAGVLTTHTAIHVRIAVATEASALSLTSIDRKMDRLIAVSAGRSDALDRNLEAERYALSVQQGQGAAF